MNTFESKRNKRANIVLLIVTFLLAVPFLLSSCSEYEGALFDGQSESMGERTEESSNEKTDESSESVSSFDSGDESGAPVLPAESTREKEPETTEPPIVLVSRISPEVCASFGAYLDGENMISCLSQGEFLTQMEKYIYGGTKITELVQIAMYGGEYGGGCTTLGNGFGFGDDYTISADGTYANYRISFHTEVALDAFSLPCGIEFSDTLAEVLKKIGIELTFPTDFISDADSVTAMTLYRDAKSSLTLYNGYASDASCGITEYELLYPYQVIYRETYDTVRPDRRAAAVTRTATISFCDYLSTIERFDMTVNEYYLLG